MKLKVVGWTYYDDDLEHGVTGWAARNAIIDDIKEHGYVFSGWAHQEGNYCAPVLNDGKIYCYSQRGWGSVMAEAHGYTGRMDYAKFAFAWDRDSEVRPHVHFDEKTFTPEYDLSETFELEVSPKVFKSAKRGADIKLDDLPKLRFLDAGDTLVLSCNGQTARVTVVDVDREKDLTEDELFEIECNLNAFDDPEAMRRAEEEYNRAKTVIIVHLS